MVEASDVVIQVGQGSNSSSSVYSPHTVHTAHLCSGHCVSPYVAVYAPTSSVCTNQV